MVAFCADRSPDEVEVQADFASETHRPCDDQLDKPARWQDSFGCEPRTTTGDVGGPPATGCHNAVAFEYSALEV